MIELKTQSNQLSVICFSNISQISFIVCESIEAEQCNFSCALASAASSGFSLQFGSESFMFRKPPSHWSSDFSGQALYLLVLLT